MKSFLTVFLFMLHGIVKSIHILLNVISGTAKLAIWLWRKIKRDVHQSDDAGVLFQRLVIAGIHLEFEIFKMSL